MRNILLLVGCLLGSLAFAQTPQKHPNTSGKDWKPLFAADLSDAGFPKGIWSVENGVLTATEDIPIWTQKTYKNFVLDLEFKNAPGTNSGVFVYCSDTARFIPNSVEIQIADDYSEQWSKAPATWQCAAFFGHKPAAKPKLVKPAGEWNRYTITCQGKKISVVMNGQLINKIDMNQWTSGKTNPDGTEIPNWLNKPWASLPNEGHVGFQGKHAGAPIYFRNMKIKELK
ncbi:3-keto-disaccharide hydrolase [Larkinella sp. VNQ87]|uniref:3-keto-disaccharide hydrolase n=1 Tax=Larkinella sp. VNQ87 TaxID=3400921 RepID=UPI003C0D928A